MRPLVLLLWLSAAPALADSIAFGAASRCDREQGVFELVGRVEANGVVSFATRAPEDLTALEIGTRSLTCQLPHGKVQAVVRVYGGSSGECQGAGLAIVDRLSVGNRKLPIAAPLSFNWSCPGQTMTVRFSVRARTADVVVERCTASDWTWEAGYAPIACERVALR